MRQRRNIVDTTISLALKALAVLLILAPLGAWKAIELIAGMF